VHGRERTTYTDDHEMSNRYFLADNLGFGGKLRGTATPRLDRFATEGMKLLNFAPESQCTPSRSALMTGRYAIRSGNQSVRLVGPHGGLVAWKKGKTGHGNMADGLMELDADFGELLDYLKELGNGVCKGLESSLISRSMTVFTPSHSIWDP
jgi:hypothetical protein